MGFGTRGQVPCPRKKMVGRGTCPSDPGKAIDPGPTYKGGMDCDGTAGCGVFEGERV